MATYAIGDIQGCFDELQQLLKAINFSSSDKLWFAGDLVNRGPKSLQTLRFIKNLGQQAIVVLGNHDLHLLAIYFGGARLKRSDTLSSILEADDSEDLMHWLKAQPLAHYDQSLNAFMSHAGLPANWKITAALSRAQEVSDYLASDQYSHYFKEMYGNYPDLWSEQLSGMDRLRCTTNYLTRMRFCTQSHQLELNFKGELGSQPSNYFPWFDLHAKDHQGELILFGHWAALMGKTSREHIIALDTGCVWGEKLTCYCIETGECHSVASNLK